MTTAARTPTASLAIPSDVDSFTANCSPCGTDLEGLLDLSLDALIKERRKEHKLKKQDMKKKKNLQLQSVDKRAHKLQPSMVKKGQKAQRKALVNKNRGLLNPLVAVEEKNKTKTSIAVTTAKIRWQMRLDKTKSAAGRLVVSPRADTKVIARQHPKKKKLLSQTRKVASPTRALQSNSGKKVIVQKQLPKALAKAPVRQVTRSNKKTKLSITIISQTGKKKYQQKQKSRNEVVLPGKNLAKNASARKVVKRTKNRKAAATKKMKVVRKVPGHRKQI